MKLEYLFTDKSDLGDLEDIEVKTLASLWGVTQKEKNVVVNKNLDVLNLPIKEENNKNVSKGSNIADEKAIWILTYSTTKDNRDAARLLSRVNQYVLDKCQCAVLTNDAAAYFNKCLYPLVNDFERKLRKLLYLMSALSKDSNALEQIKDIERQDFGKLYEMLFVDNDFYTKAKSQINGKNGTILSKRDLIKYIDELEDNSLWSKLSGDDRVPSLSKEFDSLRRNRNHVMHAHNISYEVFNDCQRSFRQINKELESAIDELLNNKAPVPSNIGQLIDSVLKEMNIPIVDLPEPSPEVQNMVNNLAKNTAFHSPEFRKAMAIMNKVMRMVNDAMGQVKSDSEKPDPDTPDD